jgi:uncharacterized protein with HEPN domain
MKNDRDVLADILSASRMIQEFIRDLDEPAFHLDPKTQYAVYAQLIIMGEAARRVTESFRQQHADLPWHEMIGMRNRIVHAYDEINWQIVWHTARRDIPDLIGKLVPLMPPTE